MTHTIMKRAAIAATVFALAFSTAPLASAAPQPVPAAPAPAMPVPAAPTGSDPVSIIDASAPTADQTYSDLPAGSRLLAVVPSREAATFQVVGASWTKRSSGVTLQIRVFQSGTWSEWATLTQTDSDAGDGGEKSTRSTDPYAAADSTGVEVRAFGAVGSSLTGLKVMLVNSSIDPDAMPQQAQVQQASASSVGINPPWVTSRAGWGANESLLSTNGADCVPPNIDETVKAAVIHHTVGSNNYTAAQSAGIVNGIYQYHIFGNGWCDIGYNFLIDKYGQIFEGRHGGILNPIHGAHASLWNTDTVGVAFMMNSNTAAPTTAALNAAASLLAWKLGGNYRDPLGSTSLAGRNLPTIFGHGDVMSTECPGNNVHGALPTLRQMVNNTMAGRQNTPNRAVWAANGGDTGTTGAVHILEQEMVGGRVTQFQFGAAYNPPGSANSYLLSEDQASEYTRRGGPFGSLGWPNSNPTYSADGTTYTARFTNGNVTMPTGFQAAGTNRPIAPRRLLDTRTTTALAPFEVRVIQVAGKAGVASNANAAVLNVTVTSPQRSGFLTVYPAGSAVPNASNVNFRQGETIPNLVTVGLSGGKVAIRNASASTTHVVLDVNAYYTPGNPTAGGGLVAVTPQRILDTRSHLAAAGPVGPFGIVSLRVTGGNVPTNATAVLLNITVDQARTAGFITAYPAGTSLPNASNVNYVGGVPTSNLALVKVGTGGVVKLHNWSSGNVEIIADIAGYVTGSGNSGGYRPIASPRRVIDSRVPFAYRGPVTSGTTVKLPILGRTGVPTSGVRAVVVNLTVDQATSAGFLTVFPSGGSPTTSNLNFRAGDVKANMVVVPVGADGAISIRLAPLGGSAAVIADIQGYIT